MLAWNGQSLLDLSVITRACVVMLQLNLNLGAEKLTIHLRQISIIMIQRLLYLYHTKKVRSHAPILKLMVVPEAGIVTLNLTY